MDGRHPGIAGQGRKIERLPDIACVYADFAGNETSLCRVFPAAIGRFPALIPIGSMALRLQLNAGFVLGSRYSQTSE